MQDIEITRGYVPGFNNPLGEPALGVSIGAVVRHKAFRPSASPTSCVASYQHHDHPCTASDAAYPACGVFAGHEFVGTVVDCAQQPGLVGKRVVGEINVNCAGFSCADAVFKRNHAPGR